MKHVLAVLAIPMLQACSERQIYDTVQQNQQLECQRYPDTRYEECMARSDTPYDEYAETRKALDPGTQ